ncbi:MAG TPA: fructose bisphosphate aldolase [Geminicoccaceae bacterium]|nr:fructose bisphosphate aldolase [Geminicoccaceae bacterium]
MDHQEMSRRIREADGFIAALDQSGGSTPKALAGYGVAPGSWADDSEMFDLIHRMRCRIITSPAFTGDKVLGAILFERTMDGAVDGKPVPQALIERGVIPFVKVDQGLEEERDDVQLMKPIAGLDSLLARAKGLGVFGTKMRSVIKAANRPGIARIVAQQVEIGRQIGAAGLMPILEPEYDIGAADRTEGEAILLDELTRALGDLPDGEQVMLKLSIPAQPNLYRDLVRHPAVARVVALSGGYSRAEACEELARNEGMIASFSRALLSDLRVTMGDEEFDKALGQAIDEIYRASTVKTAG